MHAAEFIEDSFNTPKTTAAENGHCRSITAHQTLRLIAILRSIKSRLFMAILTRRALNFKASRRA
jgi:hypothetical protein